MLTIFYIKRKLDYLLKNIIYNGLSFEEIELLKKDYYYILYLIGLIYITSGLVVSKFRILELTFYLRVLAIAIFYASGILVL